MAQKELYMRLIAHNLVRCVMAQAAAEHHVALERISFKGSLDAVRHFSGAMAQAKSKKKRGNYGPNCCALWPPIWFQSAPGRREPRAVKRKKNKYPRLVVHVTNFAISLNVVTAAKFHVSASLALCKRHSPFRAWKRGRCRPPRALPWLE